MTNLNLSGVVVSDFNADLLVSFINHSSESPNCIAQSASLVSPISCLLNDQDLIWKNNKDFAVIWAQAVSVVPSFQKLLRFEQPSEQELLADTDVFIEAIQKRASQVRFVFVVSWVLPEYFRGLGPIDLRANQGCRYGLLLINQRLAKALSEISNIYLLDGERWMRFAGEKAADTRLWFLSKIPYDQQVFKIAAADIKSSLRACLGQSRKLIILDLDQTLWGGVVGEDGLENLKIGGHDPQAEAFAEFQRVIKSYKERGILLAVVSKNDEALALKVFDQHPEMILRKSDLAGWRINWNDKAENIADLLKSLNLTSDSAVFIDDHPLERERVRQALPGILVPDLPENVLLYPKTFLSLSCFDTAHVSDDDRKRSQMYQQEEARKVERLKVSSPEEWLKSLNTEVTVSYLTRVDLSRATQLLNKTNQMNLSTRRLSEDEFWNWSKEQSHKTFTFRVKDNLGDSGLTGIISLKQEGNSTQVIDFILSCRVFGRNIEDAMLAVAIEEAQKLGVEALNAQYLPTEKNNPCLEFFNARSGLAKEKSNIFKWSLSKKYSYPQSLFVKRIFS